MKFSRSSWTRALAGLIILGPTDTQAAEVICDGRNTEALEVRIEMLDRTRQHGGLVEAFDSLTLHVACCTVGGVLDVLAAMPTTSWAVDRPHPYALVKRGDRDWRNANELRGEPLIVGTRFYYPLFGSWSVTFGANAT